MTVILASNALTVLATVKEDLGITVSTYDDQLNRLINSASNFIAKYCGRVFQRDTAIVETVKGYGLTSMRLARPPINSVTSILYDTSTVDSDDYEIDNARAGTLYKLNGWVWTAGNRNDITQGLVSGSERPLYTVTYDGGWYTPGQSRARGTLTFAGQPGNNETMVINGTTITAKTSGATGDEFDIGTSIIATCDNLVTAVNAGSESAYVLAWRDQLTVVVEWLDPGTGGNSVVLTEAMTNITVDGSGTFGGTQAGVDRDLPWDVEDACVDLVRAAYMNKRRNPEATGERLLSWSASFNVTAAGGKIPAAIARVLDQYKMVGP